MRKAVLKLARSLLIKVAVVGSMAQPGAAAPAFSRDIAPIVQSKCLGCHDAEKAKGGYRLHSFEALLKPGKSKLAPIVAGRPEQSELYKRISSPDPDDRMPQKDEPLTQEQLSLFRQWIIDGARLDRGEPNALLSMLAPESPHPAPPEKYRRPLPILALAFSPDGQQLAASGHREVTFWNLSGELSRRLTNVAERVRSLAFEPAGRFLAVAGGQPGRGGELSIHDLSTGVRETNLVRTGDEVLSVAFSSDGKRVACAGTDNTIRIYDWEKRSLQTTIQQHADWVTSLAFNTNGTEIASCSRDRTARIYDSSTGELAVSYTTQNAPLYVVAFLPGGLMVSGGRDKALHLWDEKEGKKKGDLSGFEGDVYALLASGNRLFTAGADGVVREHSLNDRKVSRTLKGHADAVYSLARANTKLASGSYDGVINIWDTESGVLEKTFVAAPGWSSTR